MPIDNKPQRKFAEIVSPLAPPQPMLREVASLAAYVAPPPLPDLGPLTQLVGVWVARGTGWNMIALPFHSAPAPPAGFKFRVLMNQYDEELQFTFVDDGVPNRGLVRRGSPDSDQLVATLDYQQKIVQVMAEDRPRASFGLATGLPIHHEPGLWLYERNRRSKEDFLGDKGFEERSSRRQAVHQSHMETRSWRLAGADEGMPPIPPVSGLPFGRFEDITTPDYDFKTDPYLAPYKHYINHPFMGNVVGCTRVSWASTPPT